MDKKKVASGCLTGGTIVLIAATLIRIGNTSLITHIDLPGLWKLSVGLLLVSIAASLNDK